MGRLTEMVWAHFKGIQAQQKVTKVWVWLALLYFRLGQWYNMSDWIYTGSAHHTPTAFSIVVLSNLFCRGVYSGCGLLGPSLQFCISFYGKSQIIDRTITTPTLPEPGIMFRGHRPLIDFFWPTPKRKIYRWYFL